MKSILFFSFLSALLFQGSLTYADPPRLALPVEHAHLNVVLSKQSLLNEECSKPTDCVAANNVKLTAQEVHDLWPNIIVIEKREENKESIKDDVVGIYFQEKLGPEGSVPTFAAVHFGKYESIGMLTGEGKPSILNLSGDPPETTAYKRLIRGIGNFLDSKDFGASVTVQFTGTPAEKCFLQKALLLTFKNMLPTVHPFGNCSQ